MKSGEMKLKVKPEGREGVWLVEKKDVKAYIKSKKLKQIHNFIPSGAMMLGADHDVKSVLKDIDRAERLAILTGGARAGNMGHALALIENNKLEAYDIGPLEEKDLEIQ